MERQTRKAALPSSLGVADAPGVITSTIYEHMFDLKSEPGDFECAWFRTAERDASAY
jgi:hypothetical protein